MTTPTTIRLYGTAPDSIVDGPGLRYAVFVQGCSHACPGCHNPNSQPCAGGTVRAICEMMKEFGIIVVGCGVAIATREPEAKRIEHYKSLMVLEQIEEEQQKLRISVNLA